MKLLTGEQLAGMRRMASRVLADQCTIQTSTTTIDALGSAVVTWTDVLRVPCKLSPDIVKNHSAEGDQYRVHAGWVLALPYNQTIASGDRVVLGGQTYEVLSVEDATTWATIHRAHLRRLE